MRRDILIDVDTGKKHPGVDNADGYMTRAKEGVFSGDNMAILCFLILFAYFLSVLRPARCVL